MPMEYDERDENALEPVELIKQSGAVLRVGRAMLTSGTGSYRVKTAMEQVARSFGLDRHEAHVTLTEITGTSYRGPIFRTEVAEVRSIGVNSNRIKMLTELANGLRSGHHRRSRSTAAVDRIDATPPLYPGWANAAFAAVACGAFSYLNNGGAFEIAGGVPRGGAGPVRPPDLPAPPVQPVRRGHGGGGRRVPGVPRLRPGGRGGRRSSAQSHEAGYISAVLFLVPGFPLVTGALDLAKLDFSAGVARTAYALMILISAGLSRVGGVLAGRALARRDPAGRPAVPGHARAADGGELVRGARVRADVQLAAADGDRRRDDRHGRERAAARARGGGRGDPGGDDGRDARRGAARGSVAPALKVPRITVSVPAVVIMVPGAAAYRAVRRAQQRRRADRRDLGRDRRCSWSSRSPWGSRRAASSPTAPGRTSGAEPEAPRLCSHVARPGTLRCGFVAGEPCDAALETSHSQV